MYTNTPQPIYLKDYLPPDYLIDTIALHIDLHDDYATVIADMRVRANQGDATVLICDGPCFYHFFLRGSFRNGASIAAEASSQKSGASGTRGRQETKVRIQEI